VASGFGKMRRPAFRRRALATITTLQGACAVYFLFDIVGELPNFRTGLLHPASELFAVAVLWLGTIWGLGEMRRLARRNDRIEDRLRVASGAFLDLLDESFERWQLTPSERDVALLAIKGLPIQDIADLRATRAGTVKAQCAAIYRKAGVGSRAELLSHFVEDLMSGLVLGQRTDRSSLEPVALQQSSP
jgi:DNA-binding CsgD family transcriptional regulator